MTNIKLIKKTTEKRVLKLAGNINNIAHMKVTENHKSAQGHPNLVFIFLKYQALSAYAC